MPLLLLVPELVNAKIGPLQVLLCVDLLLADYSDNHCRLLFLYAAHERSS
jgi:hypothetical protein